MTAMSPNGSKSSFRRRHGWLSTLIDIVLAGVCTVLLVFLVGWISRANVSAAKLKTGADNGTGPLAIYVPDDPREQAADGTDVFARWVEINSPTSLLFFRSQRCQPEFAGSPWRAGLSAQGLANQRNQGDSQR
jgi:hypothetical protein